jgi:hypothetical protein
MIRRLFLAALVAATAAGAVLLAIAVALLGRQPGRPIGRG